VFSKVLIANRGEIAVRVIRACREQGVATVAVYSDVDHNALHVRLADEAYALGGQTATESYLNTDAILDVIERSGADAVHPGYGFFSENADFARAITERGVTFIGPPPEAIEVMGDKISARLAAERVGVHSVLGTTGFITNPDEVRAFGAEHGWPVAVKAAYGGGGRGMKVVADEAGVDEAIESARRESLAYFGRDELYVELYLTAPRHIEVQVLADSHGNAVHLGGRDCSLQRRHQKLIEEAPAPGLSDEVRAAMGEAAVKVAKGCGYTNAGTVEFLYQDGEFWYLEMNTRLQVEHPVTEAIFGVDLVREQIRVAAGMDMSFSQDDLVINGHAIEVRINAERLPDFSPCPGRITQYHAPGGLGVRMDSALYDGYKIPPHYDSLIGKLIVHGPDRESALNRLNRALGELIIDGVDTTVPLFHALLQEPDILSGNYNIHWLETWLESNLSE